MRRKAAHTTLRLLERLVLPFLRFGGPGVASTLHVQALRPAGETGSVFLHAPPTMRVSDPRGFWIAKDARDASLLIRARLEFAEEGPAEFSIGFTPLPKGHETSGPDTA